MGEAPECGLKSPIRTQKNGEEGESFYALGRATPGMKESSILLVLAQLRALPALEL
jgi:hypothetical protein